MSAPGQIALNLLNISIVARQYFMNDPVFGSPRPGQTVMTGDSERMKRNPVAWAALIVASAALVSSSGFLRPMPAAPKIPVEGQQAAKALSKAYEAVAEFARPSVVQITVHKKVAGIPNMPNMRRSPSPRDFEDMLRRFFGPESGGPE